MQIFWQGSPLTVTVSDGAYTRDIGAKGGATYRYQVCETGESPACSSEETVTF